MQLFEQQALAPGLTPETTYLFQHGQHLDGKRRMLLSELRVRKTAAISIRKTILEEHGLALAAKTLNYPQLAALDTRLCSWTKRELQTCRNLQTAPAHIPTLHSPHHRGHETQRLNHDDSFGPILSKMKKLRNRNGCRSYFAFRLSADSHPSTGLAWPDKTAAPGRNASTAVRISAHGRKLIRPFFSTSNPPCQGVDRLSLFHGNLDAKASG